VLLIRASSKSFAARYSDRLLGLLPAAVSRGIGSDSQRPFAIVIVGGLSATLVMSVFILPTAYIWIARRGDRLPPREADFETGAMESHGGGTDAPEFPDLLVDIAHYGARYSEADTFIAAGFRRAERTEAT